ncbi:class I SAM-dependent DNA methyltransferase, partial [bacterium]|nr:class I SAM-dependent DNA methyltransferase [bacterium]
NPPFVGYSLQSKEQKNDLTFVYDNNLKGIGKLDYVSCWYKKAADYMQSTDIRAAFVSTNSITQGEQVAILWKPLFAQGIKFNFAYKTFKWDSESTEKAAVYCVIIGFSYVTDIKKYLYDNGNFKIVECINAYLIDGFNIFVESRNNPLCNVPKMITGNRPADGGHLIIEEEDYENFVKTEPRALKYIKKLVGSEEFINRRRRYCLWLVDASPSEISQMPKVKKRVEACQESRLNGAPDRQKLALKPAIFRETKNPTRYVLIPATSSERRKYIPIVFFDENTIATNSAIICPDATLYHFGILTSNVHMAWMRAFAGRLKSDYRYSINIVYNNFPWPNPTPEQKAKIERTAQAILEARAKYPDSSLADLYDDVTMPPELRKAHQNNDRAVMEAYGLPIKETTESSCVARLMELYKQLTIGN